MATAGLQTPAARQARVGLEFQENPVFYVESGLRSPLWSKQREIAWSVKGNRRTAVKACHGPGKTFTAAALVLWFLRKRDARVITTAPTWTQVKKLLWHEIHQLHRRSALPYGGQLNLTELYMPDGRYALGLSTRKEESEKFQGHHAENILVVVDEASGVPTPIFEAIEGYMTTSGARLLLIGNPTRPEGEFHAAFNAKRAEYSCITISAYDMPCMTGEEVPDKVARHLTSREWIEEKERTWKGTPLYDVKVLGEFPRSSDNAVIALGDVEDACNRELPVAPDDDRVVACDVARFGSDETCIVVGEGHRRRIAKVYVGRDTMQTAGEIVVQVKQLKATAPRAPEPRIVVDDAGVGGGVTDRLRELGHNVTAFNGGESALDPDAYPNRRSESWFVGADRMPDLDLETDDQLIADLVSPHYRLDSKGRRVVEPKEMTKKRLNRSPDRGDALLLSLVPASTVVAEVW